MKNEWRNVSRRLLSTKLSYMQQGAKPQSAKEITERKKVLEERQKKIDICLNCKKVCKTGICEFFPHG